MRASDNRPENATAAAHAIRPVTASSGCPNGRVISIQPAAGRPVSKVTQMAHQFARICVFGDVRVQFRQQARQQSHGLRRERPVWFGEQVVAGESRGFESGLLLVDQRLQTGTLRGDAGFCGHGPAAALKSPSTGSKQDVNPLFAQQFVMAAGSHEHGGTIIANP